MLRNIRLMENRLDKALVKHNEAASIGRTYESIISRLKDERVTFDSQLKALEDAVKAKASDAEQLASMAAEAQAAKEEAIGQLRAVVGAVERERAHRAKELAERRAQVEAAEADRAGGDPEELERCRAAAASYDEAFRRVQDATGVVNLSEFVDRFLAQENVKQELKVGFSREGGEGVMPRERPSSDRGGGAMVKGSFVRVSSSGLPDEACGFPSVLPFPHCRQWSHRHSMKSMCSMGRWRG